MKLVATIGAMILSSLAWGCGSSPTAPSASSTPPVTPSASFSVNPNGQAITGVTLMTFSASTAGDNGSFTYSWDFGDSSTANGPTVSHIFQAPDANHVVVLKVSNEAASSTTQTVITARSISGVWMNLINPKAYQFTFDQRGSVIVGQGVKGALTDPRNINFHTVPLGDYVFTGTVEKNLDGMEVSYPSPDGVVSLRLVRCFTPTQSCL